MSGQDFIIGAGGGSAQPAGRNGGADGALIRDTTTDQFMADVIEASRDVPVLVDFWAPWCGPCRQLTPILERAVQNAKGKVRLVKMNIDENPEIPGQLGIQSIPAVLAFKNGQPLDGFMGALPESQVTAFIERIAGPAGPSDAEELVAAAAKELAANDPAGAASLYASALQVEPDNAEAIAGLARCEIATGGTDRARALLSSLTPELAQHPAIAGALTALELAEQAEKLGNPADFASRVEADPTDHQARFDLALALNARGDRLGAAEALLEIVRRDREWNEEAARKQLVQFFEAWGPSDPATLNGRRRLSSLLFA